MFCVLLIKIVLFEWFQSCCMFWAKTNHVQIVSRVCVFLISSETPFSIAFVCFWSNTKCPNGFQSFLCFWSQISLCSNGFGASSVFLIPNKNRVQMVPCFYISDSPICMSTFLCFCSKAFYVANGFCIVVHLIQKKTIPKCFLSLFVFLIGNGLHVRMGSILCYVVLIKQRHRVQVVSFSFFLIEH